MCEFIWIWIISLREKTGDIGGLFTFFGVLFAIFVVYQMCIKPKQHHQPSQHGSQPPPYGFRPEFQQPPQGKSLVFKITRFSYNLGYI